MKRDAIEQLKREVCRANLDLVSEGLVFRTWGNASGLDRARGLMVIKPSGVPYSQLAPRHMVVVELETGKTVAGRLNPSSDTATHLLLYREFAGIGGVAHTHSLYATAWAQTGREVPPFGTTHADYFAGPIPCTRRLKPGEIATDYEANTGKVLVEAFKGRDPLSCPAALVASHGPFTWGRDVAAAVDNAAVLEYVVRLASESVRLVPPLKAMQPELLQRHFYRKHGPGATYGQKP